MGRKKKIGEKNGTSTEAQHMPTNSRSPTPEVEGQDGHSSEKRLSESSEKRKKQNWLKRIFSKGSRSSDAMRRSVSTPEGVMSPTKSEEDSIISSERSETASPLSAFREDDDEPEEEEVTKKHATRHTSSPALFRFRKRPVTVEVGDDVWAQVKAKQDAMFVDSSLLKVDQGVLSSAKTPPIIRKHPDENVDALSLEAKAGVLKRHNVSDEEWARVQAAQQWMFDNTTDLESNTTDENKPSSIPIKKSTSGALTALVEEARQRRPSQEAVSSAEQVKAALAKKEEQTITKVIKKTEMMTSEMTSNDTTELDLESHEFFADSEKRDAFDDVENHEFFATDVVGRQDEAVSQPSDATDSKLSAASNVNDGQPSGNLRSAKPPIHGASQATLRDLVRQKSLKLRSEREKKRYTIATPQLFEGEHALWESIQNKHQSILGDLGSKPVSDRLDGLEADIRESSPEDTTKDTEDSTKDTEDSTKDTEDSPTNQDQKDGANPVETGQPSSVPGMQDESSEVTQVEIHVDTTYLSADLSAVPVIQPTLGLSVGHMRRSLSQKNRRRPPSVRIQIPEDQDLFRIPETRARSSSTGDADEETKVQAKAAAETKTKGFQRAKTVAIKTKKSDKEESKHEAVRTSAESTSKQPFWLQELEQKRKNKPEVSDKPNPLYKIPKSPTSPTSEVSTALLVAEAAKRKTAQESLVSFKQGKPAPRPRPKSMFVTSSQTMNEPMRIGKAQKKSKSGSMFSPLQSPPENVSSKTKPEWVTKAQKMSKQEKTDDIKESGQTKLQTSPTSPTSIQDRIKSLRQASGTAAT